MLQSSGVAHKALRSTVWPNGRAGNYVFKNFKHSNLAESSACVTKCLRMSAGTRASNISVEMGCCREVPGTRQKRMTTIGA
jgi:hypothetical protein